MSREQRVFTMLSIAIFALVGFTVLNFNLTFTGQNIDPQPESNSVATDSASNVLGLRSMVKLDVSNTKVNELDLGNGKYLVGYKYRIRNNHSEPVVLTKVTNIFKQPGLKADKLKIKTARCSNMRINKSFDGQTITQLNASEVELAPEEQITIDLEINLAYAPGDPELTSGLSAEGYIMPVATSTSTSTSTQTLTQSTTSEPVITIDPTEPEESSSSSSTTSDGGDTDVPVSEEEPTSSSSESSQASSNSTPSATSSQSSSSSRNNINQNADGSDDSVFFVNSRPRGTVYHGK